MHSLRLILTALLLSVPVRALEAVWNTAQWSSTLQPGSGTPIPDTGTSPERVFRIPAPIPARAMLRVRVTVP